MLHYLAVRKAMVSVHVQTRTFENHAILLAYLANWPLYTPENGFQGAIKRQDGLFLASFLCAYCSKKLPERAPTKKQLRVLSIVDQLRAWAHRRSAYAQLSPLYPSLYPYVTHMINYTRPSPTFPYCKRRKAGRGLGTRLELTSAIVTKPFQMLKR